MIRMIKERKDIGVILNVYKSLEKGVPPDPRDLDKAVEYMYDFYEEYLQWYEDTKSYRRSDMEFRVYKEFENRYNELESALFNSSAPFTLKVTALDNAINQLHIDYPVLAHLQMDIVDLADEYEDDSYLEDQESKFNMLIKSLETILKRQGKVIPSSGYGDSPLIPARY